MVLPNYEVKIVLDNKSQVRYKIFFDMIIVSLFCDAKYKIIDMKLVIKDGCMIQDVNLLKYLIQINDFLISNSNIREYEGKYIDLLEPNIVRSIEIEKLKIATGEMEYINEKFPNLYALETNKCIIYDNANIGVLKCRYRDYKSDIITLDSYNGFNGREIVFNESHIINTNKRFIHLYNEILRFKKVDIDYETFILTLDAPNLRKLDISKYGDKKLYDKDLLFISGLYNLESIDMNAIITSLDQIKKLERLREIRGILIDNSFEKNKIKINNQQQYNIVKDNARHEDEINKYLMYQATNLFNKYLDLLNELYVKRLDRVYWQNKIYIDDIEKIKKELIMISKMFYKNRRQIAREVNDFKMQDQLDGLWFDKIKKDDDEEFYMKNSRPFGCDGIDYYVKSKKIIIDR